MEEKIRARNIILQAEVRNSVAKRLLSIMILPANDRSEKDGAIPMRPYLMAACRGQLLFLFKEKLLWKEKNY